VTPEGEVEWENEAEEPVKLGIELDDPSRVEEWWRCPRRPVKDDPALFYEVSRLWSMREKGFLPYPGSYLEQPAVLVECWDIVDRAIAEIMRLEERRRELTNAR